MSITKRSWFQYHSFVLSNISTLLNINFDSSGLACLRIYLYDLNFALTQRIYLEITQSISNSIRSEMHSIKWICYIASTTCYENICFVLCFDGACTCWSLNKHARLSLKLLDLFAYYGHNILSIVYSNGIFWASY